MVRRSPLGRLLLALALVAIGLKTLAPAGYMLDVRDRTLVLVLCSGHGAKPLAFDLETGEFRDAEAPTPGGSDGDADGDAPCVFAAAGALAPCASGAAVALAAFPEAIVAPSPVAPSPGRGLAAPPPWATGPPVLV